MSRVLPLNEAEMDRISDRVTELIAEEITAGQDTVNLFGGLVLGLYGYMKTAPEPQPDTFVALKAAAKAALGEILAETREIEAERAKRHGH